MHLQSPSKAAHFYFDAASLERWVRRLTNEPEIVPGSSDALVARTLENLEATDISLGLLDDDSCVLDRSRFAEAVLRNLLSIRLRYAQAIFEAPRERGYKEVFERTIAAINVVSCCAALVGRQVLLHPKVRSSPKAGEVTTACAEISAQFLATLQFARDLLRSRAEITVFGAHAIRDSIQKCESLMARNPDAFA